MNIRFKICMVFFILAFGNINAQNRSIDFQNIPLEDAFVLSAETGKIIFVDCYTEYCGPCKAMDATVFKTDSVADYFNSNFINIKLDMLSEEGKKYAVPYKVGAYPSFLLLNSQGELLYKFIGGMDADKFMQNIRAGLNPDNKVARINTIYESGNYSLDFLKEYILLKLSLHEKQEGQRVAKELFDKLTHEQRISPDYWFLFSQNRFERELSGVNSDNVNYLFDYYDDFVQSIGKDSIDSKLASNVRTTVGYVLRGWYFNDHPRDATVFEQTKEKVKHTHIPDKEEYLTLLDIAIAATNKDTLTAGNLLADHIEEFNVENQQILFDFLTFSPNYSNRQSHPRFMDIVRGVLRSGKPSNIYNYLQRSFPSLEELEAEKYDVPNLKNKIGSTQIIPFFHPEKEICWYVFREPGEKRHYYIYDTKNGKRELYDSDIVEKLFKDKYPDFNSSMLFYNPTFTDEGISANLSYSNQTYTYDATRQELVPAEAQKFKSIVWGQSPDENYLMIAEDRNLKLKNNSTEEIIELSTDAEEFYEFMLADMEWLGKSNKYYITRTDKRNVGKMSILHTSHFGRPIVTTYDYELPEDKNVTEYELYVGNAEKGTFIKVDLNKWEGQEIEIVKAPGVEDRVYFLRKKRTMNELELCFADPETGEVKVLISEKSNPYINYDLFKCHIIDKGKQILFWSDRTGWGHYYRYNSEGKLLNPVTKGDWTAARIVKIDTTNNQIFVYGYGRETGRNPNYAHLYKVKTDGKKIQLMTPENAHHSVFVSPKNTLLIDNYSRIDTCPVIKARNGNGKYLADLEHPDISKLLDYGWKFPEQFTVKAADGITDLYGIIWKPYDFDPDKKYPIVSQVYPGPHIETVWPDFTVIDRYNNTALAQRGIIVVVMGHRGGSPTRNKAYASYGYGNIRDFALEDDKYGLEQLYRRHNFIDSIRIGIYGHSGGAMMAVAAICTYPDFYKVAVASSGNYDNKIYNRNWVESYHGVGEDFKLNIKTNMDLVSKLKGKLLLVTGEVDNNVHPAHTYRLVNELIRKNKDFDMLVLPGQNHDYQNPHKAYFERKKRDYFTKYL